MRLIATNGYAEAWADEPFDPATDDVELRANGDTRRVRWQSALKHGYWKPPTHFEAIIAAVRDYTCEHGSLVAACHDASCRPPTSGGTGGSRPGGSVGGSSGSKGAKGAKVAAEVTKFKSDTAFGREIRSMIKDDPHLTILSAANHQSESAAAAQRKVERHRKDEARGRIDYSLFDERPWPERAKEGTPEFEEQFAARASVHAAARKFSEMVNPGFVPNGLVESKMFTAVQQHLARANLDEATKFTHGGATVQLNGATLRLDRVSVPVDVQRETEQAVNRVGKRIADEISKRNAEFDPEARRAEHVAQMDAIRDIIKKHFPDDDLYNMAFSAYGRGAGEVMVYTGGRGSGATTYTHPMREELKAYITKTGLYSHDYEVQMKHDATLHHDKVVSDVLSEIRPMGGTFKNTPRYVKPKVAGGFSTNEQVLEGASYYPAGWINRSNDNKVIGVEFKQTKSRAHYDHSSNKNGLATVTLDGTIGTTVHEMAHRMERAVPGVLGLEERFYDRRTEGETLKHLGKGYGKNEVTKEDQFFSPYAGKSYEGRAYELLSMGTQQLTSKTGWDRVDPDYQAFVLGTMASAYWEE